MKYLLILFLIPGLFSCSARSAEEQREARFTRIDSLLLSQSLFQSGTGIAVAIVSDTSIIYNKGFGYSNLAKRDTVTPNTLFHLGSVPKCFVAVALMQLVEQKKVGLDSLVIKYIPELRFNDPRYARITVRHLATHSSGIYTNRNHDWDNPKHADDALDQFVRSLNFDELRFDPGERFSYSDLNYDIIGDIISRITGIPFEDYMKQYVLLPSGMNESTFYLPDTGKVARPCIDNYDQCRISRGYLYPVNREHAPSGTLFSSSMEMCNWMIANLHKGRIGGRAILSEPSYDTMWKPAYTTSWPSGYYESMGIGWFAGSYNGKTTYLHSGTDHGYRAVFCIIPEDKYGVVILSNYKETAIHYLLDRILSLLYGINVVDTSANLITKSEYPEIVGTYNSPSNGAGKVTRTGELLYFTWEGRTCCLPSVREGNILAGQLFPNGDFPFYYDQANVFLSKTTDESRRTKYYITVRNIRFDKQ